MIWLMFVLLAATLLIVGLAWFRTGTRATDDDAIAVAHTAHIRRSQRFRSRARMLRSVLSLAVVVASGAAIVASYLAGRPADVVSLDDDLATRDIVLCLDVSGSVIEFDGEILDSFEELLPQFNGERIALVIWDATARTVFPLTDDYTMIAEQFDVARDALRVGGGIGGLHLINPEEYDRFTAGTKLDYQYGSSIIGDGLASCTQTFDLADEERSRFIIFATDNELAGDPVYTLAEAAELAQSKGITVHGLRIEPSGWGSTPGVAREMQRVIEEHGGYFYEADDASAAGEIIDSVQSQDAVDLGAVEETVEADNPKGWPVFLGVLLVALIGVAWRFKI